MNGESTRGIEDIIRRNAAALRSKANLTQQALADEMLLRGIAWTRETVAQVETTNRRLGFTEAIALAACLDVPVARLAATGAAAVAVGQSEWTTAYLGAAIAGTTSEPIAAVSASAEPETPPNMRQEATVTMPRPPGRKPRAVRVKLTIRLPMPPCDSNSPANMNSGTAISRNGSTPLMYDRKSVSRG